MLLSHSAMKSFDTTVPMYLFTSSSSLMSSLGDAWMSVAIVDLKSSGNLAQKIDLLARVNSEHD